jgi:hypothetical protein
MPLSWNEIRHRAIAFSKEWMGATREQADKQIFWNEFFKVFGVPLRAVASFEEPAKNLSGDYGYIDLFWPGKVLVEHKSRGKNLSKAESQAFRYIQDLARAGSTEARYGPLDDIAWYDKNSGGKAHEVGQKRPNAFNLLDMLGNVWERVSDGYGE